MGVWNALGIFGLNILIVADALLASAPTSHAQQPPGSGKTETESVNSSNNPLDPIFVVNLQNYYIPKLEGLPDRHVNVTILRALTHFEIGGAGNLLCISVPLVGRPDVDGAWQQGSAILRCSISWSCRRNPSAGGLDHCWWHPPLRRSDTVLASGRYALQRPSLLLKTRACSGPISGHLRATEHDLTSSTATIQPFLFFNLSNGFYLNLLAPGRLTSKTATTTHRLALASANTGR